MNKEIILKDLNNRNYHVKDFKRFKKHILEFHGCGSSIHEENGFFFRVDQKFRENLLKNSRILTVKNDVFYIRQFLQREEKI